MGELGWDIRDFVTNQDCIHIHATTLEPSCAQLASMCRTHRSQRDITCVWNTGQNVRNEYEEQVRSQSCARKKTERTTDARKHIESAGPVSRSETNPNFTVFFFQLSNDETVAPRGA